MLLFHSFLRLSSIPFYIYHIFFMHSSADGNLDCFHTLTIVNSATMNIGVHVSFNLVYFFYSDICPGVGLIARSYGSSIFSFLRNLCTVFRSACTNLHANQQCIGVLFLHIHKANVLFVFFLIIVILTGVR